MSNIRERLSKYTGNTNLTVNNTSNIRNRLNNYINQPNQQSNLNNEKEDKSLLKTVSAGVQYLGQGALRGLESIFIDAPLQIAAGTRKLLGDDEGAKGLMEASDVSLTNMLVNKAAGEETNPYKNNNQNLWNKEVDKNSYIKENNLGGKVMTAVGEMLPTIAIGSSMRGGLKAKQIGSNVLLGTKAFSGGTNEAYRESGNLGKSMLYGLGSAGTELLTEKISGGIPGLKQIGGTTRKEIAKNYLKNALGEGVEEVVSSLVNPILQTTYKGKDALNQYKTSDYWKEVLESGIVGSAVGGILDAPNTMSNVRNATNSTNTQNTPKTVYDLVQQEQNSQNVNLPIVDNNGNIVNSNKFQYVKTDNTKIDNLRKSANKYFNNSVETQNLVNTIEKVISDKNYNVVFDNTIKNKNGQSVNAQITTNNSGEVEIKINPNSNKAGEFLLTHEITHAIETDSMKKLIVDYASKNTEFNQALESLKQTYGTDDVSSEVVADISGQLFGNQEFINSLSMEQPSVFKKIYNKIIELANKITGNSRESLFIRDLKNKWETAYRNTTTEQAFSNLNDGTAFSIQTDITGNRYVNVDTDQDIFNGKSLLEQNKIARKYILDHFRENGLIYNDENVNVNSKTAIKYTNPKEKITRYNKNIKNRISTELDNLLSVSRKVSESSDKKNHSFAKDGWEYYQTLFNIDGNYFTGILNIGKNGNQKTLYDINNIKKTTQNGKLDNSSVILNKSSFSRNNIPQFNNNVKSDISTNYSMQNQQNNSQWQDFIEQNYKATGTRTDMRKLLPTQEDMRKMELKDINLPTRKTLNPAEISNLTKEYANTTPILQNANVLTGNGKSKFASNIKNKTNMLSTDSKNAILSDDDVSYYREVTNEESLNQAFERLNTNGKSEVERWFRQESENADSIDVAEGWILLKQYQDQISKTTDLNAKNELNHSMVQVAKKLRDMGTKAGQTVQAFNILNRLTPEGMVYYAQSELDEAFQRMVKNKSQNWINKNKNDFELTPQETQFILDTMQEVSQMQDGYDKRVKLAEIQKIMTDKLPPQKGAGIKAWMRISMLFNPKTQVRNVVGNALIAPVNSFSDLIGSIVDKRLAKSTNVRTTGTTSLKNYGKGFKKGLFESYNDLKKGINTRNIEGNRFEISQSKSFNDKTKIGKALNRVDNFLSFMLDAGDRGFYEASFVNSINNQMVLNNTTEVTQDMIDIATSEALQRTWQDNNNYTRFVMNIRKMMNMGKEYGLGDVLIPFAKTPANLTKAIVDYSPVGLINSINKGIRFKRSLTNGQFTPKLQHDFVQTLGKATAGTMLYVLGYALAKAGITSGESDDDKDVSNFLKNTLGVNSYSIKIGDKTFTYDWAQPLAAPLAITANMVQKEKEGANLLENITSSLDEGFNVVLEQSFFESINNVFSDTGSVPEKLWEEVLGLPSRAIPTFFKQITDMVDGTQRTSFEYDKPLETAINKVKAKIPFLSQTLSPSIDTLGRDIQKYGGNNNIFNVFLNPANVSTENISESASEIYRLYKETGDKTIMPRVAPYYINQDGNKITLSASEKAEYQSISGQIIEDNVKDLLDNEIYNAMSDENKAEIINKIVNFSYNKAREEVLNIPMSDEYNKINMYISDGGTPSDYYINKEEIDYSYENPSKYSTITHITTYAKYQNYNDAIKDIKDQYEDSNQRKYAVINYVNGLNLSIPQKAMLIKMNYNSFDNYDNQIIEYINSQNMTIAEKTEILEQLGFTVRNGRVYS